MLDFFADIHEGYYRLQEKYKGETEARKDTELFFPFVFLGYYVGIVALMVGIIYKVLRLTPISHKISNYLIAGILLFVPYIYVYMRVKRQYKDRIWSYRTSTYGNPKKIWKYLVFFCFSLLFLFLPALINFI